MEKIEYKAGDKVRIVGNWVRGDEIGVKHFYFIGEEVLVRKVDLGTGVLRCVNEDGIEQIVYPQYVEIVKEG